MLSYNLIFNKLVAIVLIGAGAFAVWMEGDGTFLMFALLIGVPMFFAKENWTIIEVIEVEKSKNESHDATAQVPKASEKAV